MTRKSTTTTTPPCMSVLLFGDANNQTENRLKPRDAPKSNCEIPVVAVVATAAAAIAIFFAIYINNTIYCCHVIIINSYTNNMQQSSSIGYDKFCLSSYMNEMSSSPTKLPPNQFIHSHSSTTTMFDTSIQFQPLPLL